MPRSPPHIITLITFLTSPQGGNVRTDPGIYYLAPHPSCQ